MSSFPALQSVWSQYFPPAPDYTPSHIPSLTGKTLLITGANSGIGYELLKLLYPTGATIYLACRSEASALAAISSIKAGYASPAPDTSTPKTPSTLRFLHLDLADLNSVRRAAAELLQQETKLDILWNNAALAAAPLGSSTAQGIEGHVGTNCVAPLLFTQLVLPLLKSAAAGAPRGSVRVVWTGSVMVDTHAPRGGVDFDVIDGGATRRSVPDYAASKVGNWWLCVESAKAWGPFGISSVVHNPGNLNSRAYRNQPWYIMIILRTLFLYDNSYGALTLAYSGLSEEVKNGDYIWPWGRKGMSTREDLKVQLEKGAPERFWKWCEEKGKLGIEG
ncbi:NAD(P)-binding protein [Byssothecium circinans]|uniref:NAD(P)-binding protein n=1 Tax=Byssothecium circinans TaxID=147558 RepID=A0A6A5TR34_9PLEO|nr:NAD(P)-binding protein [Byssothecium circinans]